MCCDNLPRLRGKLSSDVSVLRLNKIQYCLIIAKSSLEILAYHSLPKNQTGKNTKVFKQKVWRLTPVYPIIIEVKLKFWYKMIDLGL